MNIHHIKECFSPFSVTFIEERFCLFRTCSFTLFKNNLDSTDKYVFVSSFPMTDCCCGVAPIWGITTGCPVLSRGVASFTMDCAVPSCWVFSWKKLDWDSCASTLGGQLSTLEKTKLCYHPTLSSVLRVNFQRIVNDSSPARFSGRCRQRVAPFCALSRLSHSMDLDFYSFSSPGFLTSKMTNSREPLQ